MAKLIRSSVALLCILGGLTSLGCQNYRDQLQRGQGYYQQNEYEMALAVWRNLENDQSSLTPSEVVRYCYYRGMTDFRLGYRDDSRYWLGLASAGEARAGGALLPEEAERLELTLAELNAEVFGTGASSPASQTLGDACKWTSDCEAGFTCTEGTCIQAAQAPDEAEPEVSPSESP